MLKESKDRISRNGIKNYLLDLFAAHLRWACVTLELRPLIPIYFL